MRVGLVVADGSRRSSSRSIRTRLPLSNVSNKALSEAVIVVVVLVNIGCFERSNYWTSLVVAQQNFNTPFCLAQAFLAFTGEFYSLFEQLQAFFQRQVAVFELLDDSLESLE